MLPGVFSKPPLALASTARFPACSHSPAPPHISHRALHGRQIARVFALGRTRQTTRRTLDNRQVRRLFRFARRRHLLVPSREQRRLDRHTSQALDQPIGRFGIEMIVGNPQRTDDPKVPAIVGTAALKLDLVERIASDRQCVIRAPVRRAASLPRILTDPPRLEPALS